MVILHFQKGFEDYFGIGPHYRWINDGGIAQYSMLQRIRQLPIGESPEDVMRALRDSEDLADTTEFAAVISGPKNEDLLDYLYGTLEEHPAIEGLIGYSEGSCIAASLILDEMRRFQEEGRPRRIKCATFFTGWPPIGPGGKMVLSDESSLLIDIPTLHVIGANGELFLSRFAGSRSTVD